MNLRNVIVINNLESVITEPTRVTQHSSTLIDPILVSTYVHTYNAGCIHVDSNISDHRATFTYIKFEFFCHPCTTKKVWLYNKGDFNRLNELISSECWMFIDSLTVDEACDRFTTTLLRLMSECIPSKEVIIRPNDKPWFDSEIRRYIKNRNRQRNIALRKQTPSSWQKYKHLRNKVNNFKKSAKKHFFENIETNIEQNRLNNSRNYWKSLNA